MLQVLAAVDDFCRLTVRHRVRKVGSMLDPFQNGGRQQSMDSDASRMALVQQAPVRPVCWAVLQHDCHCDVHKL